MKRLVFLIALVSTLPCTIIAQNVGIGTTTPAYKLDVNGRMRIKANPLNSLSNSPGIWMDDYRDGTERLFFGMQDSIRGGMYSSTAGVGWGLNFNARTGNLGLGRTASSSRLELDDPNGGDIGFYHGNTFIGRILPTDSTLTISSANGNNSCLPNPCPAKDLILLPPPAPFTFIGNVGIGTNAPTARLQVLNTVMIGAGSPATGYALSVNGKIIGEEVKVQMDANWPDYVFQESYKLPKIEEMASYIKDNKHLKNIPSAAEVEKEGIELGDMQRRLTEKVEELSLYIIQLNERIKELEKKKN